jgi:hypothetical protein
VQDGRVQRAGASGARWAHDSNKAEWRATSGQEGLGWRRLPRWRRLAVDGWCGGCARGDRMCATVGKENISMFFYFF